MRALYFVAERGAGVEADTGELSRRSSVRRVLHCQDSPGS